MASSGHLSASDTSWSTVTISLETCSYYLDTLFLPRNNIPWVGLKSVPPADEPEQLVTGVLSKVFDTPAGCSAPEFYGNSVCLPTDEDQFAGHLDDCFVAAWGEKPYEQKGQREVHLKVLSRGECKEKLGAEFAKRGLLNWTPDKSEICAQGEDGQDTCKGEGGSPLVCLDKVKALSF